MIRSPAFGGMLHSSCGSVENVAPMTQDPCDVAYLQAQDRKIGHFHHQQPLFVIVEDAQNEPPCSSPSGQLKKRNAVHSLSSLANQSDMDLPMETDEETIPANSRDADNECEKDHDYDDAEWGFFEIPIADENDPALAFKTSYHSIVHQRPPSSSALKRRRNRIKYPRGRSAHLHPYGSSSLSSDLCFR